MSRDIDFVWQSENTALWGKLWQGGAQDARTWPHGIDVVVNMQYENPRIRVPSEAGKVYLNVPIGDNEMFNNYAGLIEDTATFVVSSLKRKRDVLVHCGAGWNRSGVVVARSLMLVGFGANDAISMVRKARGSLALSNPHFVAWLKREGGKYQEHLVESGYPVMI